MSKDNIEEDFSDVQPIGSELQPINISHHNYKMEKISMTLINKKGIDQTADVAKLAASIILAIKKSKENDGVISLKGDWLYFISPLQNLIPAVVGIGEVPAELLDQITPEERAKIKSILKNEKLSDDKAEEFIDDFIGWFENTKSFVDKHIYSFA